MFRRLLDKIIIYSDKKENLFLTIIDLVMLLVIGFVICMVIVRTVAIHN